MAASALAVVLQGALGRLSPRVQAESTSVPAPWAALAPGGIAGAVSDMGSGRPLAGVTLGASGITTLSDANGRYTLNLPAGIHDLRAEAMGYIGMTVVGLQVSDDALERLNLEMIPEHPTPAQVETIDARILALAGSGIEQPRRSSNLASVASVPRTIRVVRNYPSGGPNWDVVTMDLDQYLKGVVPSEMPSYWEIEALKAQAVAARSYAVVETRHLPYADICTTTHCQAWNNVQYDTTNRAVAETSGVVATYNGGIITAFYFGHCIGQTKSYAGVPYCVSVPCAHCAQSGYTVYYGHGVGMCQEGAQGYALDPYNWNHAQILRHYYTGVQIESGVRITAPANAQAVHGVIIASAVTAITPERIEFYLDNQLVAQVGAPPFEIRLNTLEVGDGPHVLKARMISYLDPTEDQVTIVVDNTPPSGTASAPAGWHTSTRIPVSLSANGSDAVNVQFSNNWVWEGEELSHNTGELVADTTALNGYAWRGQSGSPGVWFGPYFLLLPAAPSYQAYFRLKTSSRLPAVDLAILDVADGGGSHILAQRTLNSADLARSNGYEEIPLTFTYGAGATSPQDALEFRTWFHGNRDLTLDCIRVFSGSRPLANTLYWQVVRAEGQQSFVVRFLDAAGNFCDRKVTVQLDLTPPTLIQQDAITALAQDTVSGMNPASAEWSDSSDGGLTWSGWQMLTVLAVSPGSTEPVLLSAPAGSAADARFRIADMAGNSALSRGTVTWLPTVANQLWGE